MAVPFDSGLRDRRMGRGPARLLDAGLAHALEERGADVVMRMLEATGPFPAEIRIAFELQRTVAERSRRARARARSRWCSRETATSRSERLRGLPRRGRAAVGAVARRAR